MAENLKLDRSNDVYVQKNLLRKNRELIKKLKANVEGLKESVNHIPKNSCVRNRQYTSTPKNPINNNDARAAANNNVVCDDMVYKKKQLKFVKTPPQKTQRINIREKNTYYKALNDDGNLRVPTGTNFDEKTPARISTSTILQQRHSASKKVIDM